MKKFKLEDFSGLPPEHKANMLVYRKTNEGRWQLLLVHPVKAANGYWTVPGQNLKTDSPPWPLMLARCGQHLPTLAERVRLGDLGRIVTVGGYYKSATALSQKPSVQHFYALDVSGSGPIEVRTSDEETENPHGYDMATWIYLDDVRHVMLATKEHNPERATIILAAVGQLKEICRRQEYAAT